MTYNLFPKLHVKHKGFSFYGPRTSDEGADTDVIYNFCWPKIFQDFPIFHDFPHTL